jgi:hypothetical protein
MCHTNLTEVLANLRNSGPGQPEHFLYSLPHQNRLAGENAASRYVGCEVLRRRRDTAVWERQTCCFLEPVLRASKLCLRCHSPPFLSFVLLTRATRHGTRSFVCHRSLPAGGFTPSANTTLSAAVAKARPDLALLLHREHALTHLSLRLHNRTCAINAGLASASRTAATAKQRASSRAVCCAGPAPASAAAAAATGGTCSRAASAVRV